jgi:hypothetical protein
MHLKWLFTNHIKGADGYVLQGDYNMGEDGCYISIMTHEGKYKVMDVDVDDWDGPFSSEHDTLEEAKQVAEVMARLYGNQL